MTQFGRALLALNIDIICANSPQAKGRIALRQAQERVWHVAGPDGQRAAAGGGIVDCRGECNLDEILAWREERTFTRNLALHYDRVTATPRLLSTPGTRPHRTTPP